MAWSLACSPSRPPAPAAPGSSAAWFDEILTDRPVIVAPGVGLSPVEGTEAWRSAGEGTIVLYRSGVPITADGCRLELRVGDTTPGAGPELAFRLDGVPIELERVSPRLLRLDFSLSDLGAGAHLLTLRLPPAASSQSIRLDSVAYGCSSSGSFDLQPVDELDLYLARFSSTGLFPSRESAAGGFVMDSAQSATIDVPPEVVAVRFLVSSSAAGAMVRLTAGERAVEAEVGGGVTEIRLELPPGVSTVRAEAEPTTDDRGLWAWHGPLWEREASDPPRLVVLVSLDTFRRDSIDAYRERPLGIAPHLDRLAQEATVYEQAWSTSPWTLPSHASMFTGMFPREHGAGVTGGRLSVERDTLAEVLRDRGWLTLGVCGGAFCKSQLGLAQGFLRYVEPPEEELLAAEVVDRAVQLLDEHGGGGSLHADTFLFVNLFDPHFPYAAPRYQPPVPPERQIGRILRGDYQAFEEVIEGEHDLSDLEIGWIREAYRAEVRETDRQLGRLIAELERRGLWQDALVIVTSDHGELLGENGHWEHSSRLDRELVHVPLLVKSPGQERERRVETTVSGIDVFTTVLRFAGIEEARWESSAAVDLLDPAASRSRGVVSVEEHEAPFHVLRDSSKHSDHAILFVHGRRLVLRTQEDVRCYEARDAGWIAHDCPGIPPLEAAEWRLEDMQRDAIDPQLRRELEALGYVTQ